MYLPLAQIDPVLMVIGCLIIIGVLMLRFQKRTSQANAASTFPPTRPADATAASRAERTTIDGWEVQMHELARELTGRVDTKLAALQQLLLMVDERMAALDEKLMRLDATLTALQDRAGHAASAPPQVSVSQPDGGSAWTAEPITPQRSSSPNPRTSDLSETD